MTKRYCVCGAELTEMEIMKSETEGVGDACDECRNYELNLDENWYHTEKKLPKEGQICVARRLPDFEIVVCRYEKEYFVSVDEKTKIEADCWYPIPEPPPTVFF